MANISLTTPEAFPSLPPLPTDDESTTTATPVTLFESTGAADANEGTFIKIIRLATTTTLAADADEGSFLGIGVTAWLTILGVVAGIIALILICSLICCFCCSAISEAEKEEERKNKMLMKKKKAAAAAASRSRSSSAERSGHGGGAAPLQTETVIEKEVEHLPDGRDLTTIKATRTNSFDGLTKESKTSFVKMISKKPKRGNGGSQPQLTSIRPLSSQYDQQQPQPQQQPRAPINDSTMVEMEPILPQPPIYHHQQHHQNTSTAIEKPSSRRSPFSTHSSAIEQQHQRSRRSPYSAPRVVTNYNVEPQPQHYPY